MASPIYYLPCAPMLGALGLYIFWSILMRITNPGLSQKTIHQKKFIILFAILHTLVFCISFAWRRWLGVILGFFINCIFDAIILLVWRHKANRTTKYSSENCVPFQLNSREHPYKFCFKIKNKFTSVSKNQQARVIGEW